MIRRSPAEFYIKYLITIEYENHAIRSLLETLGLDYVADSYIERLRNELHPPEPFYPRDLKHRLSRDFIIREGLYDMFLFDKSMRLAFDILEDARAKEYIETMLLVFAPVLAIAQGLANRFCVLGCDVQTVHKYTHYFFNTGLVDSTEARALLQLRVDSVLANMDPMVKDQWSAVRKASFTDSRHVAAALPHSPVSALIAQIQMGFAPADVDIRRIMNLSEAMAHLRLAESLLANGMEFDRKALNLVQVARTLQEIREAKVKPEEDLRQQLETVALKTEMAQVPLVHDLTRGRHTADLAALPAHKEDHGKPK